MQLQAIWLKESTLGDRRQETYGGDSRRYLNAYDLFAYVPHIFNSARLGNGCAVWMGACPV